MNYDVYLGGVSSTVWREKVKSGIDPHLKVFDPFAEEVSTVAEEVSTDAEKTNQRSLQLFYIENGNHLIVFYLDETWDGATTLLEIGDAVGRDKQVIVCLNGDVNNADKIREYCDFRGVLTASSLDQLISMVNDFSVELSCC